MKRLKEDRGAALVFVALLMSAFLGVAAMVIDVGSWLTAQRRLQAAADAATLAAAQDLPDTASATSSATSYATANVPGLDTWSPSYPDPNTIEVSLSKPAPGFFSKVFDVDSVTVHARAQARVGVPMRMIHVAPIAVKDTAACTTATPSCFGATKNLNFDESNLTSSRFGLISLTCEGETSTACSSSSTGASDLVSWIRNGYGQYLDVNKWYAAVTGEKIGPVRDALADAGLQRTMLLFPVFDSADPVGRSFRIIAWAAFLIDTGGVLAWKNDATSCRPDCKVLSGHFVQFIVHGIDSTFGTGNYGVKTIALTQ